MKYLQHIHFQWYEYHFLKFVHRSLTQDWWTLQCGLGLEALIKWWTILEVLELDTKSRRDLFMLLHSDEVGRACANELLWNLLSSWCLEPTYKDLSAKVSAEVQRMRRTFDQPPHYHEDRVDWTWKQYVAPKHLHWSPAAPPDPGTYTLMMGAGQLPLPPPDCWGRNPQGRQHQLRPSRA